MVGCGAPSAPQPPAAGVRALGQQAGLPGLMRPAPLLEEQLPVFWRVLAQPFRVAPITAPAKWVANHAKLVRYLIFGVGVVVLAWGNEMPPNRLMWSFLLVLALLAVVQVLVGATGSERPLPQPVVPPASSEPDPIEEADDHTAGAGTKTVSCCCCCNRLDAAPQLLPRHALQQKTAGPGAQRVVDDLIHLDRRQNEDLGLLVVGRDLSGCLQFFVVTGVRFLMLASSISRSH